MRLHPAPPDLAATREALHATARLAGLDGTDLSDDPLDLDPVAADFLGVFFAFASSALERLRADAEDPSHIHLWPEHFDVAFDAGDEAAGRRATYGASPGDEHHPEPYLYVGPWSAQEPSPLWNATGFTGAELGRAQLAAAPDPDVEAQRFWIAARDAISARR
jgi:hypothetical protein